MRKFVYTKNGEPSYTVVPSDDIDLADNVSIFEVPFGEDENYIYERTFYKNGQRFEREPRPTGWHVWDRTLESWLPDLPAAIAARKNEIDRERDRRINLPLTYNGKNLDADARARENLKSKLEEIKSREALNQPMPTAMMVWRDADNVTHSWPTQEAYQAWLEGFTIAMSERGTLIYAAAWQHKANIEKSNTVEEILAYDVTKNWPS